MAAGSGARRLVSGICSSSSCLPPLPAPCACCPTFSCPSCLPHAHLDACPVGLGVCVPHVESRPVSVGDQHMRVLRHLSHAVHLPGVYQRLQWPADVGALAVLCGTGGGGQGRGGGETEVWAGRCTAEQLLGSRELGGNGTVLAAAAAAAAAARLPAAQRT